MSFRHPFSGMRSLSVALLLVLGCFAPASVLAHTDEPVASPASEGSAPLHIPTQIGKEVSPQESGPTFGLPRDTVFALVQPVVKQEDERANIRYVFLIAALGFLIAAYVPRSGSEEETSADQGPTNEETHTAAI